MARTLFTADFRAPQWLQNPRIQTCIPHVMMRPSVCHETELLELPDGGFIELAWSRPAPISPKAPLLIILIEEESSLKQSPSARMLMAAAIRNQWRAVVVHYRGCGNLENHHSRDYHAGDTADLYWVVSKLARRYPDAPKTGIGFGLGGNVLVKLVAEQGGDGLPLSGVISASAPLDLANRSDCVNTGSARRYQRRLLKRKYRKILAKQEIDRFPMDITRHQLERLDTLWAFDNEVTAPLYGFSSASDYYRRSSAGQMLDRIELPTLILHAQDDPYLSGDCFMRMPLPSANVRIEMSPQGGHLGFIQQEKGLLHSWMIKRMTNQIQNWSQAPGLKTLDEFNQEALFQGRSND